MNNSCKRASVTIISLSTYIFLLDCYATSVENSTCKLNIDFNDYHMIKPSHNINHEFIESLQLQSCLDNSMVSIQYHEGEIKQRKASIVDYPNSSNQKALLFKLTGKDGSQNKRKGRRIQLNTYNLTSVKEIVIKSEFILSEDFNLLKSYENGIEWLTIFEIWNNAGWTGEKHPFRINLNIYKEKAKESTELYFKAEAQTLNITSRKWNTTIWKDINTNYIIPVNQKVNLEIKITQGNQDSGKFIVNITDNNVLNYNLFTIYNYTHHPDDLSPDGFKDINPIKLYTSSNITDYVDAKGGSLKIYWKSLDMSL